MSDIIRASEGDRVYLCPASYRAALGLYKSDSPQADDGRKIHNAIHAVLSGVGYVNDLDERGLDIATKFSELVREYELSHGGAAHFYHELNVHLRGDYMTPIFEGHIDRLTICKDGTFIIWDYKTGRKEAISASNSVQQRVYVCSVAQLFAQTRIKSIVLSAENMKDPMTITTYDEPAIKASTNDLLLVHSLAMQQEARFSAGARQCEYCPARGTPRCPTTMNALIEFRPQVPTDPKKLGEVYAMTKEVRKLCDNVEDQLRGMLEQGVEGTGYILGKPQKQKEIKNVEKAFNALSDTLTSEQFISACNVKVGNDGLTGVIRDALIKKGNDCTWQRAKTFLEDRLLTAGCLEWKEKAPPIEKIEESA